jgi:hypothetical protein
MQVLGGFWCNVSLVARALTAVAHCNLKRLALPFQKQQGRERTCSSKALSTHKPAGGELETVGLKQPSTCVKQTYT